MIPVCSASFFHSSFISFSFVFSSTFEFFLLPPLSFPSSTLCSSRMQSLRASLLLPPSSPSSLCLQGDFWWGDGGVCWRGGGRGALYKSCSLHRASTTRLRLTGGHIRSANIHTDARGTRTHHLRLTQVGKTRRLEERWRSRKVSTSELYSLFHSLVFIYVFLDSLFNVKKNPNLFMLFYTGSSSDKYLLMLIVNGTCLMVSLLFLVLTEPAVPV